MPDEKTKKMTKDVTSTMSESTSKEAMLEKKPPKSKPLVGDEKQPESFADKLYDEIASVLGGNDANQFLCLTIPGQALSAEDFAYDYKNNAPKGPTIEANESRLANKLFDAARIVGTDNGLTLPYQYRTALDMLTPKLNGKIAAAKNQLRELLLTEYPYDFGDGVDKKYTLQEVFFRLYDEWVKEAEKWAKVQNTKKDELREKYPKTDAASNMKYNDEYLEWYESNAETHLNAINEKMSKVISVFTPNDMKILEGILDSGAGAELQQARQTLVNTQKLTPDGGYVYPVKFYPTNWFELLNTSFTPVDLLESPTVLATKLQTLSTRRIELSSRIEEIASLIDDDKLTELKDKFNDKKTALNKAEEQLLNDYGDGAKVVLDAVLDIAPLFNEAKVPMDIIQKLVAGAGLGEDKSKKLIDDLVSSLSAASKAQRDYVSAAQELADASEEAVKAETMNQLKSLLSPLKAQLEEIDLEIRNLQSEIQIATTINTSKDAATPPNVPKGFSQIYIRTEHTSLDQKTTSESSSHVSTSGASFWFCGYNSEHSDASSSFSEDISKEKTEIEIGMNVAKVSIEREWFNPGVFALTKDMFNVTSLRISPNPDPPYTEMSEDRIIDMATSNSVFPCYPTAMVIARDISVKLTSSGSISKTFSSMVEKHASTGGGFLFFSGASSSSSQNSTSGVHVRTYDETITIKFDTPQIIGYYMEATPPDKSSYLDDVSADNQAGYVTIEQFVTDYEKMLEEMRKKEKE